MIKMIAYLLWIAIIVLGVCFSQLNTSLVHFNYYWGELDIALSILLVLAFALGGFLGILASLNVVISAKCAARRARLALKRAERAHENPLS